MKKLNLMKPDLRNGFLEGGHGEKVEYLQVPAKLGIEGLQMDIQKGAKQFSDCLEKLKKNPTRFIIIDCVSKEEGLMAVSYLASQFCKDENIICDENSDAVNFYESQEEIDEDVFENEDSLDDDIDNEMDLWMEEADHIPVISFASIIEYNDRHAGYRRGAFRLKTETEMNQKPYWLSCRKESICITHRGSSYPGIDSGMETLSRFEHNKHVFFLNIRDGYETNAPYIASLSRAENDKELMHLALMYTADIISVSTDSKTYATYQKTLFDSWIAYYNFSLCKSFPKHDIVKQIVDINSKQPSQTMEKVMQYIRHECVGNDKDRPKKLTKQDFDFLQKFTGYENRDKDPSLALEDDLVGMEGVKKQVREIVNVMKFNRYRKEVGMGEGDYHNVHLLIGAPGTAKTTVARIMGEIMNQEHLLSGSRFISINGADLKGMYVGHSAPKTQQIFERNDIIFIDEAYSIATDDEPDSYSQEALAQLMIELENHSKDKLILFAGYGGMNLDQKNNKMRRFLDANPGIKSRINTTIYFDSYTPEQMLDIVHLIVKKQNYHLSKSSDKDILAFFHERQKDKNFGNGREARSLVERIIVQAASRVMNQDLEHIDKKLLTNLTKEDVIEAIKQLQTDNRMQNGKQKNELGFAR